MGIPATKKAAAQTLSPLETAVLRIMVDFQDATPREVLEALPAMPGLTLSGVRAALDRLVEHRVLTYRGGAHDNYYIRVRQGMLAELRSLFSPAVPRTADLSVPNFHNPGARYEPGASLLREPSEIQLADVLNYIELAADLLDLFKR